MNKAEFKEMPSSDSYVNYKILNSLIAPRDSSYLQACLMYFYSHESYIVNILQCH